tara:strand:+ start:51 stop:653 length:603 start_codon:yes stop_codon:yes gene_type:complete
MDYWGNKDTSIGFCENKYDQVFWIAEYYNTVSSLTYILVATPFLNGKLSKIAWSTVGVGVGSMMLHGSMRFYGQWVDEISMLLYSYYILRYIDKKFPPLISIIITAYLLQWHNFLVFLSIFFSMQIRILNILIEKHKFLVYLYSAFFTIGLGCWTIDQFMCSKIQEYQLHAYWHIFTSMSMLTTMITLYFRDKKPVALKQ